MKWLLNGALFFCVPALAQQRSPAHPEGANVIAVLLSDSGAVALERVGQALNQRGYRIKTRDQTACFLNTEPRLMPENSTCSAAVQVTVMGHTALFSGIGYRDALNRSRPLSYSAYSHVAFGNTDCIALGWGELEAIVRTLPGKRKAVYFHHL